MAGTRSSTRNAGSSPSQDEKTPAKTSTGTKRKADTGSSPTSKRGKKSTPKKEQKTIEETMPDQIEDDVPNDIEMQEAADESEGTDKPVTSGKAADAEVVKEDASAGAEQDDSKQNGAQVAKDEGEKQANGEAAQPEKDHEEAKDDTAAKPANGGNGAVERSDEKEVPSNIIEKGVVYFFTRGRVGVEEPDSVQDLQRSYLVLRPLPLDAKLTDGAIQDLKNNRLIAIPKKVLPKSGKDRFMVFVEKAKATMEDLKENFFQGSEYETKTVGTRQTPPVTPVGEGIYAVTTQGATTHLVYMLTIPSEIGKVQEDMGIRSKGSFIMSLKNPTVKGPANATLPQSPEFPQEMIEKLFHGRAWAPPSQPSQLDYENAQLLLIGEGEQGFDKATEATSKDEKSGAEEVEELEHEDEIRVEHLHGDNTVFDDLGISHKDYPKVLTTW